MKYLNFTQNFLIKKRLDEKLKKRIKLYEIMVEKNKKY